MRNFGSLRHPAVRLGLCFASMAVAILLTGSPRATGQSELARLGLPQDWSHRHVVFSNPPSMPILLAIRQDPRLLHQWLKFNAHGRMTRQAAQKPVVSDREPEVSDREPEVSDREREDFDRDRDRERDGDPKPDKSVDWSVTLGVGGTHLPISMYPAKYTFDINAVADCTNDFVVFPTFNGGSAAQATIVAYNQLYSTQGIVGGVCNHNGPTVKWAYRTGHAIRSSPVLSLDGKKVAWVAAAGGFVEVLTIGTTGSNGTSVTVPAVPSTGNNAAVFNVILNGARPVSASSLFVDYTADAAYVGDDGGVLHKVTGVFGGSLTEVITGGWPITVSSATAHLTGPVFDTVTRNIFVADNLGHLFYVREAGSTSGACASGAPPCLGSTSIAFTSGAPIVDPPIVDSSTGRVFTEIGNADGLGAELLQADTALGSTVRVVAGRADGNVLRTGTFNNSYFSNPSTGFFYFCGKNFINSRPTLFRVGFNGAGVMNSAIDPATPVALATGPSACSPAAEIFNNGSLPNKDWLFVSVANHCAGAGGGAAGCVMSFDITAGMPAASLHAVTERGGTSGMVVDNVSTAAQASSIYFTNQANGACGDGIATGGCAIKLTQSGLQ
jgi:hypothetical protein